MNLSPSLLRFRVLGHGRRVRIPFVVMAVLAWVLPAGAASETFKVAMRDGTHLATDVYRPEGTGPWPVIMLRFPYNKAMGAGIGPEVVKRGYVFVAQDTRGRFAS